MTHLKLLIAGIFYILVTSLYADGLLMPEAENYPRELLINRMTQVTVKIHGLVAETTVYQEFVNDWYDSTDAVYSFPLPPDARATELLYWYKDKVYRAVLKVKEQDVNPGTGEGGIAAEVNKYIGRNGIRIRLKGIPAGGMQKVSLRYMSLCDYYLGTCSYKFPLDTKDFVRYPLENLQFTFEVESNSPITAFDIPTHPDFQVIEAGPSTLKLDMVKPKAYINQDLEFYYQTDISQLGVDFYSVANDTMDGHFALFLRPQNQAQPNSIFPKRIFYLLSNSSRMFGYKLDQSISAISRSLDNLTEADYFNIVLFNYYVSRWKSGPVQATPTNIQSAKDYLSAISSSYGSNMSDGIKECLREIPDESYNNAILIFTDGRSPIDPREIESLNIHKTGIFPIGIGDDLDRARLEMTAALNYGFVTYMNEDDNLSEKMLQVFDLINQPVMQDVAMEYGRADITQLIPEKIPSLYAGYYFFMAGRYQNAGKSVLSIAGTSVNGVGAFDFNLDFNSETSNPKFVETLWAKQMIDALEWEIEIYGETPELKQKVIELSLRYNIRCRYTAYFADYKTEVTGIPNSESAAPVIRTSYISGNYPNPFNPSTTIKIFIHQNAIGQAKLLRIFNSLGQLVAVIDISQLTAGWHEIVFNGRDIYGNALPSGIYFVRLQIGNQMASTIRINLVK